MKTDILFPRRQGIFSKKAIVLFLAIFLSTSSLTTAQQITASYTTSAPEATLFFLNPGYINPALGSGVLGMHSNPAGLRSVNRRQFTIAYGTPQSSSGRFSLQLLDESNVYLPFSVDADVAMKEVGGLGAIGYAQQHGAWTWGVSMLQARKGGITLDAGGVLNINANFQFDQPITKEMVPDLPVDEIPITWDVAGQLSLGLQSKPAELYLSILPIEAAIAVEKGIFALGMGLTYYRISSSNQTGYISTSVQGNAAVTGIPFGIDPETNQPWLGSVGADVSFYDTPLTASYKFQVSGHRYALSVGGVMNWGVLSLGANFSHGFKATVNGSYDITTIVTSGLPEDATLSDIELEITEEPVISGRAKMDLNHFTKDTLSQSDNGTINIGGYNSLSLGLYFLGIGAFAGADVPQSTPDLLSTYLGAYIDIPLPWLPLRINAGGVYRSDSFMSDDSTLAPFRVTTHIGGGIAIKMPFNRWFKIGDEPGWLRFGVRSSLTSVALEIMRKQIMDAEDKTITNAVESLAMSVGLEFPF